jgi:hypothetical protein
VGLLLVLCAVVPAASAERQKAESSKADHRTIHESEAIAPWLVSLDQGLTIIGAALESRHTDTNADCSNLVHEIYERAGFTYAYANSTALYRGAKEFRRVIHPQPGDLVVWRGHMGIVISPVQQSFFSAMRSGRGVEFYDSPYWQARGKPRFFRYLKSASRDQLTASTRNEDLKRAESRELANQTGPASDVSGTPRIESNGNEPANGTIREDAVAAGKVSGANPAAAPSPVDGPREASLHNSDSQTTREASSVMDRDKPTRHKIQSSGDGVWERTATKPSAGIPFVSVVTPKPVYVPQTGQDFRAPNNAAKAGHARAMPALRPTNESRAEPVQWEISRYVPRPPWSSSGRTSRVSVPRPPARRQFPVSSF